MKEAGHKFREEIMKIKQELMKSTHVGTYAGDRIIEEAENDPNIILGEGDDNDGDEDEKNGTYG